MQAVQNWIILSEVHHTVKYTTLRNE